MLTRIVGLLFLSGAMALLSAAPSETAGVLDFGDGNRATGTLVEPGVFRSDRFGVIHFQETDATFSAAMAPEIRPATPAPLQPPVTASDATSETKRAKGRLLENWKFSLAGFWDERSEGATREATYDLLFRFERPRKGKDRFSGDFSYSYVEKLEKIDRRRATAKGEWDHDLAPRWLFLYRPEAEYDGRNLDPATAAAFGHSRINYALIQNQVGIGYRLIDRPTYKTNISANWAFFHIKFFHVTSLNLDMPVFSLENDFAFPWKLSFKHNARAYYYLAEDQLSFSSELELKKQITDLFYLSLRHEYRLDIVEGANELNRLRLLFGLDF